MKKKTVLLIVAVCAFFVLGSVMVMAEESEIPDLIGTWKGEGDSIVEMPGKDPIKHLDKYGKSPITFTFVIDMQNGRTFSGIRSSAVASEKVIGIISHDNKSLYMVDEDGTLIGRLLSENQMEMVYLEINPGNSRVVAVRIYTRED